MKMKINLLLLLFLVAFVATKATSEQSVPSSGDKEFVSPKTYKEYLNKEQIEQDLENVANNNAPDAVKVAPDGVERSRRSIDDKWDSLVSPYAPQEDQQSFSPHVVTEVRLKKLREELMYWYWDKGGSRNNEGDYQNSIQSSSPTFHKNLNFQLPFFGFRFNYTRISLHGYLEFSDPPPNFPTYPLVFPNRDWPKQNDHSFIGIFYSKCRIGSKRKSDIDQRKPGVYFRLERDLQFRRDVFGIEMRDRLTADIREGVIGAESFEPKHAIIATWKNVTFEGGLAQSMYKTNTFQLVLATDEVFTYAIFNYKNLQWTSHTEANGDTLMGEGGIPAFVGFNAGNGTRAFSYYPYSQASIIRNLISRGFGNNIPGRHIFRIDENIMLGACDQYIDGVNLPLRIAPESGNMLGGTIVNITGPCFRKTDKVRCKFDVDAAVVGIVVSVNRAICIQPKLFVEGYIRLQVSVGNEGYKWKGQYFIEPPASAAQKIFFEGKAVYEKQPSSIKMVWIKRNLTINDNAMVSISLWGFRERTVTPEFVYIDQIAEVANTGEFEILPTSFHQRNNYEYTDIQFGFLQINLTDFVPVEGTELPITRVIWSRPIPLAWYFSPQWEIEYGTNWPHLLCDKWIKYDRFLRDFTHELHKCPCTLEHALNDKGRFLPDINCDKDYNPGCQYNKGAVHCVRSGPPMPEGSEQQCCYNKNGYLMLTHDLQWGSTPFRSHSLGYLPWDEARKVPTLSQWFHDIIPKYLCCMWQDNNKTTGESGEQSVGCETFRFERRPTQDCVGYQPPGVAGVYGDPHIITFDDLEYTFNGLGEYTLVKAENNNIRLDVQGRFQQMPMNVHGEVRATELTAVTARGNTSTIIEVRRRPKDATWRYKLDVLANGKRIYFDRPSLKFQHFPGVLVYTPTYILNQSEVIIMFDSGAGVEVVEDYGHMKAIVYLPRKFSNQAKGLFGNWNSDTADDFTDPYGTRIGASPSDVEGVHRDFGQKWMLEDRDALFVGRSLFHREHGKTSSTYNNRTFIPVYHTDLHKIVPENRSLERTNAELYCHECYQCQYDYAMTLDRNFAHFTLNSHRSLKKLKEVNQKQVISCGVLETPRFGRKSNFLFIPQAKVTFECNENFILVGDQRRECMPDGHWDVPKYGYTKCLNSWESLYTPQDGQRLINGYGPRIVTDVRPKEPREELMYWYFDQGGSDNIGDYQNSIQSSTPTVHKNFNFQLPFFGFRFNYTRISLHGYLEFSDRPPNFPTYPLVFPNRDWPKQNDHSFIGIFYSKCRIGSKRESDIDQRKPGVYFRLERDLQFRRDVFGIEMRDRLTADIREGVIGAESFEPKHAIIATWKNVTFEGGLAQSMYITNTFQLVLATDEVFTYAIFNYKDLQWTSHTEANGDTLMGEGGIPAYVGFNAGNGTRAFSYYPFSQTSIIRDLISIGFGNNIPGRHIFRIDENIMLGACDLYIDGVNLPLMIAPESGNMLGGTIVNITGPCFRKTDKVRCKFDVDAAVVGIVVSVNRAICIQPKLFVEGYIRLQVSVGNEEYKWKGQYFIEPPASAAQKIFFEGKAVYEKQPSSIKMVWIKRNLTINDNAMVSISLWGFRERTVTPEFVYIDQIAEVANTGKYEILPASFHQRNNYEYTDIQFGFLQINLTDFVPVEGTELPITRVIWSRPIPLAWYFSPQWEIEYGTNWPHLLCDKWIKYDRFLRDFTHELHKCPCTLEHALNDKGRFLPDINCDKDSNPGCQYNKGAVHCVRSGPPTPEGSEQQCCYNKNGYLMLTHDQQWGSTPFRSHSLGYLPWDEARKVPTLSQWFHDIIPKYLCCMWQDNNKTTGESGEQSVGCETFRFERRPTQDCVGYQPPGVAGVYGDPHIITFDGLEYTFNGLGEYALVKAENNNIRLEVQGRFQQMPKNANGEVRATELTAVTARGNTSTIIEVRRRPKDASWRYKLDVLANGKRIYFDRPPLKFQHFPGVLVYTPTYILNQSEVIIMFDTGAGVEVVEDNGHMKAIVYLPRKFSNQTKGLFGNWNSDTADDFTDPYGTRIGASPSDVEGVHRDFGQKWMLEDRDALFVGRSLFHREHGKTSSTYNNKTFIPVYHTDLNKIVPENRSLERTNAELYCHECYQCQYDYAMTLDRNFAQFTLNSHRSLKNLKEVNQKQVISCGVLETPRFGRKSNFLFIPEAKVTFECNENFILVGDQRRVCMPDGHWDVPKYGYTECLNTKTDQEETFTKPLGYVEQIILTIIFISIVVLLVFAGYRIIRNRRKTEENEETLKLNDMPR